MNFNIVEKLAVVKAVDMMILADGEIDRGEIAYLGQLMNVLDFDNDFINEARALNWNQAIDILKAMSDSKKQGLYIMLNQMAEADGVVDDDEKHLLVSLWIVIGMDTSGNLANSPNIDLDDIYFVSSDHLRYQNSVHVSGPHGGAKRAVKIEPNIKGGEGYSVTIYNLDGNHPLWQSNVQMATKPMKIVAQTDDEIELRGFGRDMMGSSFSDYGLSIIHNSGEIKSITLHMHDRDVDIKYLK